MISSHSHSGQFCKHAVDPLETVVLAAISQGFKVYCLTEHMPRYRTVDLYPEEAEMDLLDLHEMYAAFYSLAQTLKIKYAAEISLLIGVEIEWIYDETPNQIAKLVKEFPMDLVVGSVHHVDGIPVDFSQELFDSIIDPYNKYFDAQFEMLQLNPHVVAHFDLVRLYGRIPQSAQILAKIDRNIKYIADKNLLIEINSRGIAKQGEVYPSKWILDRMLEQGCRFTTSDDSHGAAQVGKDYLAMVDHLNSNGIHKAESVCGYIWYF